MIFALLASLAIAAASKKLIESPIRRSAYLLARPRLAIALMVGAMSAVVALQIKLTNLSEENVYLADLEQVRQAKYDLPVIYEMGCDEFLDAATLKPCRFGLPDATNSVYLVGDSLAAQWFSALDPTHTGGDWKLTVLTKSACPMLDRPFFYPRIGREYKVCSQWREALLQHLVAAKPDLLVFGSSSGYPFTPGQWRDDTRRLLSRLSSHVGRIAILAPTPSPNTDLLACAANNAWRERILGLELPSGCSACVENFMREEIYRALQEAATTFDNVDVVDLGGVVCPDNLCEATRAGVFVFRDGSHLTDQFVRAEASGVMKRLGLKTPSNY